MQIVDKILGQIKECIDTDTFKELETDKIELKDLSTGDGWRELYKSVDAFLNTGGGIVIVGINENNKKYSFKGFNANNEAKLKELPRQFTSDSGQALDLSEYVRTDLFEIRDFLSGRVCILYIEKLPDDRKYVMFDGIAYERKLTGDHKIPKNDVDKQRTPC